MSDNNRTVLRRQALRIGGATLVGISGLASGIGSAVLERPAQENDGATQEETLVASSEEVDIGAGESVETWLYKEQFPGPELRVSEERRFASR